MSNNSPTVRQRELGRRLRDLRNQNHLTVEEVAEMLMWSPTKISRLESGGRRPSLRDVRDLCEIFGADDSVSAELMDLAREAREQGWWTQYADLKLDPYLGLEQEATAITSFTTYYLPALLQTEEYARAVIKAIAPKMDPGTLMQRVEARMRRQQVLEDENRPRYRVLLDEAVLHRAVGGPEVMAGQLDQVLDVAQHGKVTIQIVPFGVGVPAAQDSNFILFEFAAELRLASVVFVEGLAGNQYLEKLIDIARYYEAIEYLRDSALTPGDSLERIDEARRDYTSLK